MATASVALREEKRELVASSWIITQKDDLIWFIGSVVSSYIFLAANLALGVSLMVLVWIWALGFDGPHVYGTVSRTYADSQERREKGRLLYGTLLLFLVGPAMVLAGRAHLAGTAAWGPAFFLFASLWAYYHLVKQHYGFMILYKKKNNDLAEFDNLVDRAFLLLGMTYPLMHFLSFGVAALERAQGLVQTQSGPFMWLENLVLAAFVFSAILFVGRQIQRVYLKLPIDGPKLLLLGAALPMHWLVLRLLEPVQHGDLAAVATLTIYHNIQYHRIIWFHNRNKYASPKSTGNFGLASVINKNVWRYIVLAVLFGAAYHIPHYTLVTPNGIAMSFIWGGAFSHYYLDSKIWRVRRDKALNQNLQMAERPAAG